VAGATTPSSPPRRDTSPTPWPSTRPTAGTRIIEQVHADLKDSAFAHLPSGKLTANAAWLVLAVIAFNLTRAAGVLGGPRPRRDHRHDPPPAHQRPRPGRDLGTPADPAPAEGVALVTDLDSPVHRGRRPTPARSILTTQRREQRDPRTTVEH
jgi:hypothetical protein